MCGLAGLLSRGPISPEQLRTMSSAIVHRGPDAEGLWLNADRRVGLAHRRLSIIDLSEAGAQPMTSPDGRHTIVFNGEIYNFRSLRAALEAEGKAPRWRGHSDTEVLLAAISAWGLAHAVRNAHGMFAFALWDSCDRTLTLGRDRFGEKPLYYSQLPGGFAFASELKALRAAPGLDMTIDAASLRHLLGFGYVAPDRCIWRGVHQIAPGTLLTVPLDQPESARESRYYDYVRVVTEGAADPVAPEDALSLLEQTLGDAIARQLVADVPVGTFLSGGIDSSLITALAARRSSGRIKTFSIGFAEAGYDEAPHARAVAAHLGTDHHEYYVSSEQAREIVTLLPRIYDEPFGDSSQIPTYLISAFAREHVTVALSGDAGDELFGGYNRHRAFPAVWRRAALLPAPLRRTLLGLCARLPPALWNHAARLASGHARPAFFGHKIRRTLATTAHSTSLGDLYARFLDEWEGLASPLVHEGAANGPALVDDEEARRLTPQVQVMLGDALHYLPGDILTKVDRAAMAVSLEGRIPFLDPEVAALAARIPTGMKFAAGNGKAILRELLYSLVPQGLVDRPKAGFAVPVGEWIKGPMRDWAEGLLSEASLKADGLLAPAPIRARWQRHLEGREDATQSLWSLLMYQAWRREWG